LAQSIDALVSKAILTAYNASTPLQTAIPGGIHREKVRGPSAGGVQTRPYAVYKVQKGKSRNKIISGGTVVDYRLVTFFIYDSASNMATSDAAIGALRSVFHAQPLTDTSPTYTAISVIEVPVDEGKLVVLPQRGGESQWQAVWQMEVCSQI